MIIDDQSYPTTKYCDLQHTMATSHFNGNKTVIINNLLTDVLAKHCSHPTLSLQGTIVNTSFEVIDPVPITLLQPGSQITNEKYIIGKPIT